MRGTERAPDRLQEISLRSRPVVEGRERQSQKLRRWIQAQEGGTGREGEVDARETGTLQFALFALFPRMSLVQTQGVLFPVAVSIADLT